MQHRILFIHKDIKDLTEITSFVSREYAVFTTSSSAEALTIVANQNIHLVYCDMKQSTADGMPLLEKIRESYPDVIRIVLGDQENDEAIINALSRNIAKACLYKPWNSEKILKLIDQVFEAEKKLEEAKLLSSIINLTDLPTIKTSYQRIIHLIDADGEIEEIVSAIESDPAISAKILRIANSAYYGIRTASIKQAFMYLGFKNIRDLVLSSSVFDMFNADDLPTRLFQPLWQQAFITGKIIHSLYKMMGKKALSFITSAGVLMNIGIVFFLQSFTEKYMQLIQEVKQGQDDGRTPDLESMEMQMFGVTHSTAGGYLLNWWGMPFQIVEAALYHHTPLSDAVINKEYLCVLHVAEHYSAQLLHYENHGSFDENTLTYLGISPAGLDRKLSENIS